MLSFHNDLYNITGFLYYTKSDGVCGLVNLTPERSDTHLIAMRRGLRRGIPSQIENPAAKCECLQTLRQLSKRIYSPGNRVLGHYAIRLPAI